MANNSSRTKSNSSKKNTSTKRKTSTKKTSTTSRKTSAKGNSKTDLKDSEFFAVSPETVRDISIFVCILVSVLLFISNLGYGGVVGNFISNVLFGIFGLLTYLIPILFAYMVLFFSANKQKKQITFISLLFALLFVISLCGLIELFVHSDSPVDGRVAFVFGFEQRTGGGFFGGIIASLLVKSFGLLGAYITSVIVVVASFMISYGKSLSNIASKIFAKRNREYEDEELPEYERPVKGKAKERDYGDGFNYAISPEAKNPVKLVNVESRPRGVDEPTIEESLGKNVKPRRKSDHKYQEATDKDMAKPRRNRVVRPDVALDDTTMPKEKRASDEMSELKGIDDINYSIYGQTSDVPDTLDMNVTKNISVASADNASKPFEPVIKTYEAPATNEVSSNNIEPIPENASFHQMDIDEYKKQKNDKPATAAKTVQEAKNERLNEHVEALDIKDTKIDYSKYQLPSPSLLQHAKNSSGKNTQQTLKETAQRLQSTLDNFGVDASVSDVTCGPAVTRFEVKLEPGVKVNKIVNLSDDIKLNLAATDIRIEAPIPGKAAVGIEVPNKEAAAVSLRELIESNEFKDSKSKIAFSAGRDIAGNVIISDIAKMPHVLIAGSTGSGKSVCINTIIMSILYKAKPDEVKFIMIDPKVVELSVYNGIPHLLIPVVTDPKKAAGALAWAVKEMMDRYEKFAENRVRDMAGYNELFPDNKMPQIVIIVDELADLMMVASKEVEESICRLAQLARAAGIHLVIATQRPSVNVITGLIKANMPSRIAFAVTSGVDSRTILDMNGAEKLLGKGDMLYFPQGMSKPLRVQGAFVSDHEVSNVVNFIKKQSNPITSSAEQAKQDLILSNIEKAASNPNAVAINGTQNGLDSEYDALTIDAGRFIIEKEKASIGQLQRKFSVGFNRAARIMDQLEELGVVGPEQGTKPRTILVDINQFEELISAL